MIQPARISEHIKEEIEVRFGSFSLFFSPALETPEVLENLWQQTLSAYVNNPLPALFKKKLFACLSRYCIVPYCIVCHSCALQPLGMTTAEVRALLKELAKTAETNLEKNLCSLVAEPGFLTAWLEPNSALEESLLFCSEFAFLNPDLAGQFQTKMHHLLGHENYSHWTAFLTYVKTCHLGVEAYPELSYEAEKRVRENLGPLLQDELHLAEFFRSYSEMLKCECQSQKEKLDADLAGRKQVDEQPRKAEAKYYTLLEHIQDVFYVTDPENSLADLCESRLTGVAREPQGVILLMGEVKQ